MTLLRYFLPLLACAALPAADTVEVFGLRWRVPLRDDWKVERQGGAEVLKLLIARPSTQPRRPTQYALAETPDYRRVTVEAEMKKEPFEARKRGTSLIIVYAWRDAEHFNYVHLSVDTAKKQPAHNGVFHVYGGDRARISSEEGPAALSDERWYKVRVIYDGTKGLVEAFVDGKTSPALRAVDLSLGAGKIGLGSFFDLGEFRNVVVKGEAVK